MNLILIKTFLSGLHKNFKAFYGNKKPFFYLGLFLLLSFEALLLMFIGGGLFYIKTRFPGGEIFIPKLIAIFLMVLFSFLVTMSFISATSTIYAKKEITYLFTKPIPYEQVFSYTLFKNTTYLSIGAVLIFIPFILGILFALGYGFGFLVIGVFITLATIALAGILGAYLVLFSSMYLVRILRIFKLKFVRGILEVGVVARIIYFLIKLDKTLLKSAALQENDFIETFVFDYNYSNLLYPFNWFMKLYEFYLDKNILGVLATIIFVVASIVLLYNVLIWLASKIYYKSYQQLGKYRFTNSSNDVKYKSIFVGKPGVNLILKDALVHIRDPQQWSQLSIFFILILIYIFVVRGVNFRELNTPFIVGIISLINLGIGVFLISTLSLRFVYPNISIEGNKFWLLKTLPVTKFKLYFVKLIYFWMFFVTIGVGISFTYTSVLGIVAPIEKLILLTVLPMFVVVISLFFYLGVAFPDFKEQNPSKISTSVPGLAGILGSNALVIGVIMLYKNKVFNFYQALSSCIRLDVSYFKSEIVYVWISCFVLNLIIVWAGYRRFKKLEG